MVVTCRAHRFGERSFIRSGLVGEDGQWRLQEMRKVRDMRPCSSDDFRTMRDQAIELARERRNLGRKLSFEPACLPLTDAMQRFTHAPKRLKTDANLDHQRGDEPEAEGPESPETASR